VIELIIYEFFANSYVDVPQPRTGIRRDCKKRRMRLKQRLSPLKLLIQLKDPIVWQMEKVKEIRKTPIAVQLDGLLARWRQGAICTWGAPGRTVLQRRGSSTLKYQDS